MVIFDLIIFIFKESGVSIALNDSTHFFQGTVTIVSGDNPASAALGGFKQSASAFRFCRHCLGTENDIQSKVCFILCIQFMCRHITVFLTVPRFRLHYSIVCSALSTL